jgi:D-cysteine desulfhydrase
VRFLPDESGLLLPLPSPVGTIRSPGGQRFWLKDDGGISPVYGGNKARKLGALFALARRRGATRLVVHGDIESHTVMAVGLLGRAAGFAVDAVLFAHRGQSFAVSGVERLRAAGVRLHRAGSMLAAVLRAHGMALRRDAFLVPLGGSTPESSVGYAQAVRELLDQVNTGLLPAPDAIYMPFATGGSVAGLLIGLAASKSPARVVAVQAVESIIANRRRLAALIRRTLAWLRTTQGAPRAGSGETGADNPCDNPCEACAGLDARDCLARLRCIDARFLGRGYRDVPAPVVSAVSFARQAGLELEPAFSGKALACLLADLDGPCPAGDGGGATGCGRHLLFWNTHARSPAPPTSPLPALRDTSSLP